MTILGLFLWDSLNICQALVRYDSSCFLGEIGDKILIFSYLVTFGAYDKD